MFEAFWTRFDRTKSNLVFSLSVLQSVGSQNIVREVMDHQSTNLRLLRLLLDREAPRRLARTNYMSHYLKEYPILVMIPGLAQV